MASVLRKIVLTASTVGEYTSRFPDIRGSRLSVSVKAKVNGVEINGERGDFEIVGTNLSYSQMLVARRYPERTRNSAACKMLIIEFKVDWAKRRLDARTGVARWEQVQVAERNTSADPNYVGNVMQTIVPV